MSQEVIEETMKGKMNLKVAGDGTMMYHREEMIVAEMTKAQEAIEGDMKLMMRNDAEEKRRVKRDAIVPQASYLLKKMLMLKNQLLLDGLMQK